MVVVLAIDLAPGWIERLRATFADRAVVLPASGAAAVELARTTPITIVVASFEALTTQRLLDYQHVLDAAEGAVTICVAPADARSRIRSDELFSPDYWIDSQASTAEASDVLSAVLSRVSVIYPAPPSSVSAVVPAYTYSAAPAGIAPVVTDRPGAGSAEYEGMQRLLSALSRETDLDGLLTAYVDCAADIVRCAGYCLLWRDTDNGALTVRCAHGLPREVTEHARLSDSNALIRWYHRNSRILTRAELAASHGNPEVAALLQEFDILRGCVAVPLMIGSRLRGLLMLGDKIVGTPYAYSELETLFTAADHVGRRADSLLAQRETSSGSHSIADSVANMPMGLITMDADGRIGVCNAYAAKALGMESEDILGRDLRCLPSPLGDHLHATYTTPQSALDGVRVTLPNRGVLLRVSTSVITGQDGRPAGSLMLLEDVTEPIARAAKSRQQRRLDTLSHVIGRIAHNIRTPLTAIKTYAELMEHAGPGDGLDGFWKETVSPELERLEQLIGELVQVVEQPEPEYRPVRLEQIVEQAISDIFPPGEDPGGMPEFSVAAGVPEIVADPGPTHDAVSYLLRFLRDVHGSRVNVIIDRQETPNGLSVSLTMTGNLNGSHVDVEQVLDPIFALQQPDGDLGPAISRQLIDRQGATLRAAAADGKLKFEVLFPITVPEAVTSAGRQFDG